MNTSQRIGAIGLFAVFAASVLAAHVAYGPLAAVAIFAVLVCPLAIGLVYCLPDDAADGAPGQAAVPHPGRGVVRP